MAEKGTFRLKDPQMVRIFISSPFNGMEEERETLAKFYWPKLESVLANKGLKLRLVDLRWGITSSSSSDSQTVNICLREIERSDIFIGFYGQRYGWHGKEDKELQSNYDASKVRFPWIEKYRDKSVTELEYRMGYLNNPGSTPACFCFRNKKYDDKKKADATAKKDKRVEKFYSAENDKAKRLLDDLKKEVKASEKHTLGVLMDYNEPETAVKYIYDRVSAFVEDQILYAADPPSASEKSKLAHTCFLESRCGTYVGGERYFSLLDEYVNGTGVKQPLTVTGVAGSGKSALLANWAKKHMAEKPEDVLFFHFVGCEPKSSKRTDLMVRLIENMHLHYTEKEYHRGSVVPDEAELWSTLEELLSDTAKHDKVKNKRLVIIVDRLDQISYSRTSKPLFWLPKSLPENMRVILTVTTGSEGSDEVLDILNEDFSSRTLEMQPLTDTDCQLLCKAILDENSKSMEQVQLNRIIKSPKTNDPFFLHILINELCLSGNFRKLDAQIETLLESDGVHGLLCNILKRVDKDYQMPHLKDNMVERILCAVALSRNGLNDIEIPYAQHTWAPLIYALEKFLINRSGLISFSFSEMTTAVETFYMSTEERKKENVRQVAEIFLIPFRTRQSLKKPLDKRTAIEVPYHLKMCEDKAQMIQVIGNIEVFNIFFETCSFDLNEYWRFTGLRSDEIASIYIKNLGSYIENQNRALFETEDKTKERKNNMKVEILEKIISWMDTMKLYHGLGVLQDYLMETEEGRSDVNTLGKQVRQVQAKYSKACILSDSEKYNEALALHLEVLQDREALIKVKLMKEDDCAMSYNGIGLCYYHMGDAVEAGEWFTKAIEAWKKESASDALQRAGTYTNLGLVYLELDRFHDAYECFEKSNDMHDLAAPGQISLDIASNYHNMALVQKNMMCIEAAEKMYTKSLKIKEKLLGRNSYDVALTLMNIGTLLALKKDHKASLSYNQMSLAILKKVALSDSSMTVLAQENVVSELVNLNRHEEAEPLYRELLEHQKSQPRGIACGNVNIHRKMVAYYLKKREGEKAAEIALSLLISPEARPTDLAQLIMADSSIQPDKRSNRPHEATFEYGMSKWPNQRDIVRAKLMYTLIVEQKKFFEFVASYCESEAGKAEGGGYTLLIDITMNDLKDASLTTKLVMLGLKVSPDSAELKAKLDELVKMKR